MLAVIYCRVSQDNNDGRSVSEQEAECRAIAEREGWTVDRVFSDPGISASRYSKKARPDFDALRQHLEHSPCDVLVTWEASRSTRDLATYVALRDLCRERGIRWSYSGRTYDLADDQDQFGTGLDALLAEQESARTRKRVLRSVRANAAAGRPHGRNAYGYHRVYDPDTKALLRIEIDEDQAAVLREAARRAMSGESFYLITRDLNERGLTSPTGGTWWATNLPRLLKNPTYAGQRTHNGAIVGDAIWPPMFGEEEWAALQKMLADPDRNLYRDRGDVKHLLSGIATCGAEGCGHTMRLLNNRGNMSYTCAIGFHVTRKRVDVDNMAIDFFHRRWKLRDLAPSLVAAGSETPLQLLRARIVDKRARLESFYDEAAAGRLTASALTRIEGKMLPEIEQMEAEADRLSLPPVLRELAGVDVVERWDSLTVRQHRALLRHYLTVKILPVGKGRRTFDPAGVLVEWKR